MPLRACQITRDTTLSTIPILRYPYGCVTTPVSAHKISPRMIETVEPTLSVILVIFLPDFLDDVFVVEHGQVAALLRHASVDCGKGTGG